MALPPAAAWPPSSEIHATISGLLGSTSAGAAAPAPRWPNWMTRTSPLGPEPPTIRSVRPIRSAGRRRQRDLPDPALAERAESITDQLRLLVPGAELPRPGSAEGGKLKPAQSPRKRRCRGARDRLPADPAGALRVARRFLLDHQPPATPDRGAAWRRPAGRGRDPSGDWGLGGGSGDDEKNGLLEAAPTVAVLQPVGNEQAPPVRSGFSGTSLAANVTSPTLSLNEGRLQRSGFTARPVPFPFMPRKVR